MSATPAPATTILAARRPQSGRRWPRALAIVVLVVAALAGGTLWAFGYRPGKGFSNREPAYVTVEIGRGEVRVVVLESGSLESADNAMIKCQVEALLGAISTAQTGINGQVAGGRGGLNGQGGNAQAIPVAAAAAPGATGARAAPGGARAGTPPVGRVGAAISSVGSAAMAGGGGGGGGGAARPQVQSFTMQVAPHVPLRPKPVVNVANAAAKGAMAGGMGGRGGGGGNRGAQQPGMEKQGSTRIISLVPEGSLVKQGDIVCNLDASALSDELRAQSIRWEQAKSWVDQANEVLKVAKISYQEYKEGIYPQDLQQIEKYTEICETQLTQAIDLVKWSADMTAKSMLGASQLKAAEYSEERCRIALLEAKGMKRRLTEFTGPRLLKNLEAKISAVEADLLAQSSSFQLEDNRRRKLQKMIELCVLRAPRDGMVAYASDQTGPGWSPTAVPMAEGVTVRQGQTIVLLPDPRRMRAKVRVNESKMSQVFPGQKTAISIEAFPDQPLTGKVLEITPIPAPANGPISDVKLYYANVEIDGGGFAGLRTGLSAQVAFLVDHKTDVTRIPVDAIRWSDGKPFAAVPRLEGRGFDWKPIELGLVGSHVAEVKSGLKVGDRVVAAPENLPSPSGDSRRITGPVTIGFGGANGGS